MINAQVESMKGEARKLLSESRKTSLIGHLKRLVSRDDQDYIRWPDGMLLLGLSECGFWDDVMKRFRFWQKTGGRISSPEDLLALQVFADMKVGESNGASSPDGGGEAAAPDRDYVLLRVREFLDTWPFDSGGSIIYNKNDTESRIFADGIGMCCPILMDIDSSLAVRQLDNFCEHAIDRSTGLPFHAYSRDTKKVYGPAGWGRASGWLLMGTAGAYRKASGEEKEHIGEIYEKLAVPVRNRVREEKIWRENLSDNSAHTDTSASAMILYSEALMGHDVSEQLEVLKKYITPYGRVLSAQGECRDAGDYSNAYGSYPWSVGMTLAVMGRSYLRQDLQAEVRSVE